MLEDIKKIEGINNTDFDDIINQYIDSAKKDLVMAGIAESKIKEPDELIKTAIITYVQAQIDVTNSNMYQDSYFLQKDHLRHYKDYMADDA